MAGQLGLDEEEHFIEDVNIPDSPTLTQMEEDDVVLDMDTFSLDSASEGEYDSDVSKEMWSIGCYLL